jgi:hypothetical protein
MRVWQTICHNCPTEVCWSDIREQRWKMCWRQSFVSSIFPSTYHKTAQWRNPMHCGIRAIFVTVWKTANSEPPLNWNAVEPINTKLCTIEFTKCAKKFFLILRLRPPVDTWNLTFACRLSTFLWFIRRTHARVELEMCRSNWSLLDDGTWRMMRTRTIDVVCHKDAP